MTKARPRAVERRSPAPRGARPRTIPDGSRGPLAATWSWALLIAAVACGVYANSLGGALLFDDTNAIVRNAAVRNGDVVGIVTRPSWWAEGYGRGWRPVTTLSFAANHALHGLAPGGYHLVNVALHAGVSVLVLVVFARVTGAAVAATIAALLFAAHPVHTEAVASVVGRAELLATGGFFLAWLLFLRADTSRRSWALEALAVAVLLGAMLAKENAITLLPVLVLADLLYPDRGRSGAATVRRHAARYAALLVASVAFVALRTFVIGPHPPGIDRLDNPLVTLPQDERVLTAIKVVGLYAWRLLVPVRLAADYSYQQIAPVTSLVDVEPIGGLAALLAVPGLIWWAWRRAPALALGAGFLAVTFAPIANLFFAIGTIMAERLLYLPSAGFCLMAGVVLARLPGLEHPGARSPTARGALRRGAALVVGALVALYGVRTWTRNTVWRDPLTFFTAMVEEAPLSARSHRELGNVLASLGRSDEARRAFERSLAIKPGDAATLYNLGNALTQAGDYDAGVEAYEQALAAKPDFVDALSNLGNLESMRGDQQAALRWMRRALELTPRSAALHMNVANTLFRAGNLAEARAEYETALALAPDALDTLINYGTFLSAQGEYDAAIAAFERASRTPSPMTMVGLTAAYRASGRLSEARATQARAERLFPGNANVRQMGELLRRDGGQEGAPAS